MYEVQYAWPQYCKRKCYFLLNKICKRQSFKRKFHNLKRSLNSLNSSEKSLPPPQTPGNGGVYSRVSNNLKFQWSRAFQAHVQGARVSVTYRPSDLCGVGSCAGSSPTAALCLPEVPEERCPEAPQPVTTSNTTQLPKDWMTLLPGGSYQGISEPVREICWPVWKRNSLENCV